MFAYERPSDKALVIAEGISDAWLDRGEVGVEELPTWWGRLRCSIQRDGAEALRLDLAPGLALPPGGIVLRPPLARPLVRVEADGQPITTFDASSAIIRHLARNIVFRF
jgi:hypothetical protein